MTLTTVNRRRLFSGYALKSHRRAKILRGSGAGLWRPRRSKREVFSRNWQELDCCFPSASPWQEPWLYPLRRKARFTKPYPFRAGNSFNESFRVLRLMASRPAIPLAIPAYREGQVVGYILSSWLTISSTGYSAKPLDIVVGLDLEGKITGAAISAHSEPILIIGVTDQDLNKFVDQLAGLDIRDAAHIAGGEDDEKGLDAVSGATISSLVINDAVLRSARAVAASRGILGSEQANLIFADYVQSTWQELNSEGSLGRLFVSFGRANEVMKSLGGRLSSRGCSPASGQCAIHRTFRWTGDTRPHWAQPFGRKGLRQASR